MDFKTLPTQYQDVLDLTMDYYQPFVDDLLARELDETALDQWMLDWTSLAKVIGEQYSRLAVMNTQDTTDEEIEAKLTLFLEKILPASGTAAGDAGDRMGTNPAGDRRHRRLLARGRRENMEVRHRRQRNRAAEGGP